jgi:antitoxin (DNA-binding transcriptional repressor) of toxin-antitoxin stability system
MRTVGIFEAKTKLSELIEAVKRGEEIRITQRGKPVARLVVDNEMAMQTDNKRDAIDALLANRKKLIGLGITATVDEIIEWKNDGRKY